MKVIITSPFNTAIPENPGVVLGYGQGALSGLPGIGFNGGGWGVAIFDDEPGRPHATMSNGTWIVDDAPIPSQLDAYVSAMAALGDSERHMDIVEGDRIYNFYGMSKDGGGTWSFSAAGVLRNGGSGFWNNNLGPWLGRASGFAPGDMIGIAPA